ncbi:MAG: hypothetical protein AAGB93_23915 [Planctomycetota bacterium]
MPLALLLLVAPVALAAVPLDVIPAGYRRVAHEMVVLPSEILGVRTLVCWTSTGLGGPNSVVVPGEPFGFSSKYGSRLYLLPEGADPADVPYPRPDAPLEFPSAAPPVAEIGSLPAASSIHAARTTLRLVGIDGDRLSFEVVSHESFDAAGRAVGVTPLSLRTWHWPALLLLGVALLGGLAVSRRRHRPTVA